MKTGKKLKTSNFLFFFPLHNSGENSNILLNAKWIEQYVKSKSEASPFL